MPTANPWTIYNAIASLITQAYRIAWARLLSTASSFGALQIERDRLAFENRLLRRQIELLTARLEAIEPHRRPRYTSAQRLWILWIMRLRQWSAEQAAGEFVLHVNTIRLWLRAMTGGNRQRLLGATPWNRYHDAMQWLVRELRGLFPEPETGCRTIAAHILQAGVQISKSSVCNYLRPGQPRRPRPPLAEADGAEPYGLLTPDRINQTWHLDITCHRFLWMRWHVAALIDGYSRKLLMLRVYDEVPITGMLADVVRLAAAEHGIPATILTDRGSQFRKAFEAALKPIGIHVIRGPARKPCFNGKIERFFRSFKLWLRAILPPMGVDGFQRRLDDYRDWYNTIRPHQALGGRTPNQVHFAVNVPPPIPVYEREFEHADFDVRRINYRGDPDLPVARIHITLKRSEAA